LLEGRVITVRYEYDGIATVGEYRVIIFRNYLPAGVTESGKDRPHELLQLYTDPGGMRTVAIKDVLKVSGRGRKV
jgi:hypothetical protein